MLGRRIAYLTALIGSLVFYVLYREWFSWVLLLLIFILPWFSLLLSLPAMLTVKADLRCPPDVRMDVPVRTQLRVDCRFPVPPIRCTIRLTNQLNGRRYLGKPGELIPTEHCGQMTISYPKMFVYDYLGLFRRDLSMAREQKVYIMPKPVVSGQTPKPEGAAAATLLRPKPGGGYSEIHDLRLYRPGDDLRHIHWKLSAKTGKLIYREPMEPVRKGYLLTLALTGDAKQLDHKLGQLLWTSQALTAKGMDHTVRCLTGKGVVSFEVQDAATLTHGMQMLLESPTALHETVPTAEAALWQQHIGGDGSEA